MLSDHQPTHVREEESSFSIMRIGIGLCEFMMNSVEQWMLLWTEQWELGKLNTKYLWSRTQLKIGPWNVIDVSIIRITRSCHVALYDLWVHNLCAPAVIPVDAK